MTASATLVRASDGETLRQFTWSHKGAEATFLQCGKDDARLLRAELQRAAAALAAKVVADLW